MCTPWCARWKMKLRGSSWCKWCCKMFFCLIMKVCKRAKSSRQGLKGLLCASRLKLSQKMRVLFIHVYIKLIFYFKFHELNIPARLTCVKKNVSYILQHWFFCQWMKSNKLLRSEWERKTQLSYASVVSQLNFCRLPRDCLR